MVSTHTPTLENTIRNPYETRIFYEQLLLLITPSNKEMSYNWRRLPCKNKVAVVGDGKSTCSRKIC